MPESLHRVLLVCEPWFGSTGWGVMAALRRLGHEVNVVNYREIIPKLTTIRMKVVRGLLLPWFVRDYNRHLLEQGNDFEPDILLVIKGTYVLRQTLREFRRRGVTMYNYYPDVSFSGHDRYIPRAIPEYDHIFTTKSFHVASLRRHFGVERATFIPHAYMPDVHKPLSLAEWDRERYGADVSFIGMHSPKKERLIASIHRALPDVSIRIWGNLWNKRCLTPELKPFIEGHWITGWDYSRAIQVTKINLGINSEAVGEAGTGDLTSRRSFEIPACGGFMIHERNDEIRSFYEEGREIVCFGDSEELIDRVRWYLDHPEERKAIAGAGYERCVPAYSYDERMKECVRLHEQAMAQKEFRDGSAGPNSRSP